MGRRNALFLRDVRHVWKIQHSHATKVKIPEAMAFSYKLPNSDSRSCSFGVSIGVI